VSGQRVQNSGVVNLTSAEWLERWRRLRQDRPDLFPWPQKRSWQPLDSEHPDTLRRMHQLAMQYLSRGQYGEAEPLYRKVLEALRRKQGADHPDTLQAMNGLAVLYWRQNQLDRSTPLLEEAVALMNKKLGPTHKDTLTTLANLGINYRSANRLDDAIRCLKQVLAASKPPSPLPVELAWVPEELAGTYQRANRFDKAEPLYRELLEQARMHMGADDPNTTSAMAVLGLNLLRQKKHSDAEKLLRDCLALRKKNDPDGWTTFNTQSMLGEAVLGQKRYADAEALLRSGYEGMKKRQARIPFQVRALRLREALQRLVRLYDEWGKKDEAARWRKELEAVAG
jgi:tetratricopeptide (TPR) repeat protein